MIDIGWTYVKDKPEFEAIENVFFEPQKLSEIYNGNTSMFRRCPANTSFLKSLWVIKSPVDITIKYSRDRHEYDIIGVTPNFVNTFFDGRLEDFDREKGNPLISLMYSYLFVADEPVWIETYPAFLHGEVENTRFVNGGFNIYNWQRPVDFSFEMRDSNKPIVIKREQPLFYVKFIGNKFDENFNLKRIQWDSDLNKIMRSCQPQNFIQGLGWKLMQLGNKIRPKKLVK